MYKLTDFGAARELQEEEQFMSLYGTEEYLVYYSIYSFKLLNVRSSFYRMNDNNTYADINF